MRRAEEAEQLGCERHVERGDDAEMQRAAHRFGRLVQVIEEGLELTQDRARMLLEDETGGSEEDSFSFPLKKRHAQACLQIPHLLRNTGLRDAEPIRRATEAARFRDREEVAQMSNGERIVRHREEQLISRRELPCKTFEAKMPFIGIAYYIIFAAFPFRGMMNPKLVALACNR